MAFMVILSYRSCEDGRTLIIVAVPVVAVLVAVFAITVVPGLPRLAFTAFLRFHSSALLSDFRSLFGSGSIK
jgi:hypothetical protein